MTLSATDCPVVLHTRVVSETGGGPEKTILNSPRFLDSQGYRLICAYMHPPRDPGFETLRERALRWRAPLVSIEDRGPWDARVAIELLALCRRERVKIWHAHDYKSNAIGLLLRRFWPMKLVTTVHGWINHTTKRLLYNGLDRFTLRHYERVVCVSHDLFTTCAGMGVPKKRLILLENAIDSTEFARRMSVSEAKGRLGIPASRLVIGAVGRLSAEKGFDMLIAAADRLRKSGLDIQVIIVGEGDEKPALQRLVAELKLESRVSLLGYRADVIELYQAMDVFALSSLREGLPNVVLEAMALEVPIVATRIAGVPRVIEEGQNGLLVNAGDVDGLTRSLGRLLEDASLRQKLGNAARKRIETQHSFAVRMQKVRAIYDSLVMDEHSRAGETSQAM
jgi:glycosyltransferase involved in cell wall biosynthesis